MKSDFGISHRPPIFHMLRMEHGTLADQIAKLKAPALLHGALPHFRQSCVAPRPQSGGWLSSPWPSIASRASVAEASNFESVFAIWKQRRSGANLIGTAASANMPRLVFFGEQHHQREVLRAQLQVLHAMATSRRTSPTAPQRMHLVLEHFSLLDQSLIDNFSAGDLSVAELSQLYDEQSQEGFNLAHYAPLLILARELDVHIHAGFPPRAWAKLAMREGLDAVASAEQHRKKQGSNAPEFTLWDLVRNVSSSHRAYLDSLMHPEEPPKFIKTIEEVIPAGTEGRHPTEAMPVPPPQSQGFVPAQVLKDAFLAHAIASLLVREQSGAGDPSDDLVLAICGSGHCEYGFGAPERVLQLLAPSSKHICEPFVIISKPRDSDVWHGDEWPETKLTKKVDAPSHPSPQAATTSWGTDGWDRQVADAILLYDWED